MKFFLPYEENITTDIVLITRRPKKDGTCPVKLRITFNRIQYHYSINLSVTQEDFTKIIAPKPRGIYKEHRLYINAVEEKAREVIESIDNFTFAKFKDAFFTSGNKGCIITALEQRHKQLVKEGRVKYAVLYVYLVKKTK